MSTALKYNSSFPQYNKFSSGDPKSVFLEFIALDVRQLSLPFNAFFLKIQACDFDNFFYLDTL